MPSQKKNYLYAYANKCNFHTNSVEYLSYMLSPADLSMANYKVKTIQEWPKLHKVKDLQSFLRFTNFYWRFIFNYSDITILLTCLTRKGIAWNFTPECRESFETLKKAFTMAPVLTHWVPNMQIILKMMPLTTPSPPFSLSHLQTIPKSTRSLFTPRLSLPWS